jgi:penicillin amidase
MLITILNTDASEDGLMCGSFLNKRHRLISGSRIYRIFTILIWCAVLVILGTGGLSVLNRYQTRGALNLPGLTGPVTVQRDEKGMAFIRAQNLDDLLLAQGFVTAQDRLFQMHLIRLLIQGRTGELAGKIARDQDMRMRTIGLDRLAEKQAAILNPETAARFQRYVDGINAFIDITPHNRHLEFRLAGISPEKWDISDSLSLLYYLGYATAANLDTEVIIQMLLHAVGYDKTRRILPLNIHPDDPGDTGEWPMPLMSDQTFATDVRISRMAAYFPDRYLRAGSNNWAVSPDLSATGAALLCGDTHLDPRMLPGVWYPIGLICPGIRAVGVNIPGIPGMAMGRTSDIALSMTNNYADIQDLYLEQPDPDHPGRYLSNNRSLPFETRKETLKLKDSAAPGGFVKHEFIVRATERGPIVTDVFDNLPSHPPVSLRFAPAETMGPEIGLVDILEAKNSVDVKNALKRLSMVCLNWVFADDQGRIGYQVSGRVPIRQKGYGTFLSPVSGTGDPWQGWIPDDQMPAALDPPAGWIGTCNHKIVSQNYPYYYSSYFAPRYRYDRLKELMALPGRKTPNQMWMFQRDTLNPMARIIAPKMIDALMQHPDTREMGAILSDWNYQDDPDTAGPAIFQTVYRFLAKAVFEDELKNADSDLLLNTWYFWQERLQHMILEGRSVWFDDVRTPDQNETLTDLFLIAGHRARAFLEAALGPDMNRWHWGRVHTLSLRNPLAQKGWIGRLLGKGPLSMGGSGETLYRGWYDFDAPFFVTHCASLRMVVDFADTNKIMAVLPGGVTGRMFHPHQKDQVTSYMSGEQKYWWFSDSAINGHTVSTLALILGG